MKIDTLLTGLAAVTTDLVGYQLSTVKNQAGDDIPSVFKARRKPPKPSYPYSACDYVGVGDYGSRGVYTAFDGMQEKTYFNRRVRLRVAFYGNVEDDVQSIAAELKERLRTQKGKGSLALNMEGAGLMAVSEPTFNTNLLTTDYEEFSSINIDFWVISEIVDDVNSIDDFDVHGKLYQNDYNQPQPPLDVNATINTDQE